MTLTRESSWRHITVEYIDIIRHHRNSDTETRLNALQRLTHRWDGIWEPDTGGGIAVGYIDLGSRGYIGLNDESILLWNSQSDCEECVNAELGLFADEV